MSSFTEKPVQQRRTEVYRLLKKYPDKIPVIIQKDKSCQFVTGTNINKFLVPADLTVGQLIYTLRQRVKLSPEQALFIFFNQQIVNTTSTMREIYTHYHNKEDEMLYATYSTESTFG
jgi:GABA(A) receptor-associated protein